MTRAIEGCSSVITQAVKARVVERKRVVTNEGRTVAALLAIVLINVLVKLTL